MVQAIRQRSAYGGRTTGPVNPAFIQQTQAAAAANPFNTYYMTTALNLAFSESNQRVTFTTAGDSPICWTGFGVGDYIIEFELMVMTAAFRFGLRAGPAPVAAVTALGADAGDYAYRNTGTKDVAGVNSPYGDTYVAGDKIAFLRRRSSGTIEAFKNGASQGILASEVAASVYLYPCCRGQSNADSARILTSLSFALPPGASYWI